MEDPSPPKPFRGWHSRGYLPHCDFANTTQSINFRLFDAIPPSYRKKLDEEPNYVIREKIREGVMDRGYGSCLLRRKEIGSMIEDALLHFHLKRYRLIAWCIMQNHVHALVRIHENHSLSQVLHSWRSFTAHEVKKLVPELGGEHVWARDYFDRFTRDSAHFWNVIRYYERNPVKAKLCASPEDWPFSSARFDRDLDTCLPIMQENVRVGSGATGTDGGPSGLLPAF